MDTFEAIMIIEEGAESEEQYIEAFQALVDSGVVWRLQGSYGRAAARMIEDGILRPTN